MGLTFSAIDPQVYLDLDFLAEINRRVELYMPEQSFSYGDVIKDGTPLPSLFGPANSGIVRGQWRRCFFDFRSIALIESQRLRKARRKAV